MSNQRPDTWLATFTGLITAAVSPMRVDLSLDLERIPAYVDFLIDRGSDGLMVAGTTGEFITLSVDERMHLVSRFITAVDHRRPVIAHIGHVQLPIAQRLAEQAATDGADALAAIVPYFHHVSESAIIEHLRQIARTCPEIPFLVYNYPAATGNRLSTEGFAALLEEPNVRGIKASIDSWEELQPFLGNLADVLVVCGNDGLMARFVAAGGRAIVSGNAAALPDTVRAALAAVTEGAEAGPTRELVSRLVAITLAGASDRLKELLRLRGMDVGPARVVTHTATEASEDLRSALDALRSLIR